MPRSPRGAEEPNKWAAVYDELRSHQCLSSVINDPRGKGLNRSQWEGISDFWEAAAEIVEELGEARDAENQGAVDGAVSARTDALIGLIPELPDFSPYLDTFADIWEIYHRSHRRTKKAGGHGGAAGSNGAASGPGSASDAADAADACDAHREVPHEYFRTDFKLEQHAIFRQSLQTSVERQEDLNMELTGHLDRIEVALFEQIRRAQRDQLFDSMSRLNEPLQEDLKSTLTVLTNLRGRLRSVQRRQLRSGLAVGRLARRNRRAEEVLQRLDCLAHVQQSLPSIQMLLQGQDYITALDLLETTSSAVDSSLKGVVSARPSVSRLAGFTGTFDRSTEADFVHHSAEAILLSADGGSSSSSSGAGAPQASAADAAESGSALRGAERLKCLCWCLARRELLRLTLGASLRDVVLAQLKKVLKHRAKSLLEEQMALQQQQQARLKAEQAATAAVSNSEAAASAAASAGANAQDADVAAVPGSSPRPEGAPPASSPRDSVDGGGDDGLTPASTREAQQTGITAALSALSFEGLLVFWRQILQDAVDVAARFTQFAALIQGALLSLASSSNGKSLSSGEASGAMPSAGRGGGAVADADGAEHDLLRLFEAIVGSYLQKVGVLLQARQGENRSLKADDWKQLLRISYCSLDKVRDLQESCRQRLSPKQAYSGVDVRAGLRTVLYSQTKAIVEEFDKRCIEKIEAALEQERWERTDVPSQYKKILDQLLGKDVPLDSSPVDQGVERFLHVDGVHFPVAPAVLTLIQLLNDYVRLCSEFESLPEVVVQRMCALLKLFNGRTHQLVLSGQAVHKQALKKISANNLALCSQCCGLVAQVLPNLQTHLHGMFTSDGAPGSAGHATSSGSTAAARSAAALLVADLSKIANEYNDHRTALFSKLSDLLVDRYQFHSKKWFSSPHQEPPEAAFKAIWEQDGAAAPAPDGASGDHASSPIEAQAHEALDGFAKDITNMYRVLLKHLTGDSVRKIFAKAFEDVATKFDQRLSQEIGAPSPPYEDKVGRSLGDRLALDVAFLRERMEKLSGITTPLQRLQVDLIRHLQARLPASDPLKALHPAALEVLQQQGRVPR